jgi:simple sugar transport system permease protein
MQFSNPEVPYQAFIILPYLLSILALVGLIGKPTPPGAVGIPYEREGK